MTPAFAHWLIRICSKPGETILDPFCGIGTIPLEANLIGRHSIGFDLNPYAYVVADAKMDRRPLEEHINWLTKVQLKTEEVSLDVLPDWVKLYYNPETLREIIALRSLLEKEKQRFLLGCFLGVAQGHRIGHLSKHSALTLPYKPRDDDPGEYKAVIPRMIQKVRRMYKNGIRLEPCGTVKLADARKMPLADDSVDVVISSPPYFDTVDYVSANRLRLALMGYYGEKAEMLRKELIQDHETYPIEMEKACNEIRRVLKPGGRCILVLGDSYKRKRPINTAVEVQKILDKIGMKTHGIIADKIPFNRSVQRTPRIRTNRGIDRLDRIMVVTNQK